MSKKRKKVGLVLGGGGARGLTQIGILKVLDKAGVKPDFIVGSSIGAAIGAAIALGITPKELELEVNKYQKKTAMTKFIDPCLPKQSLIQGKKIARFLSELYGEKKFSDTLVPFFVNATDLASGKEVVLKKGRIDQAVLASISVPGIFPPVKIDGKYLIDGGVVNPTPIDVARKKGADLIIAVDFILKRSERLVKPNIISTLLLSYEVIRSESVKRIIRQNSNNLVLIKPKTKGTIDSFKFTYIKDFIKAGEEAALAKLDEIKSRIN